MYIKQSLVFNYDNNIWQIIIVYIA